MTTIFDTPESIAKFKAIAIKHALILYAKTGLKANTAYTPKKMLLAAEEITGRKFKRGQYSEAAQAIEEWLTPPYDVTGNIIAFESGELDDEQIIELFQHLINSGLAWQLQGHYGRTAHALIEAGYCQPKES